LFSEAAQESQKPKILLARACSRFIKHDAWLQLTKAETKKNSPATTHLIPFAATMAPLHWHAPLVTFSKHLPPESSPDIES
jgi:hypothetical protein